MFCYFNIKNTNSVICLSILSYCFPVAQCWSFALAAQRLWVRFPGNTCTDKKCIACKSLWIKASAKCINVNILYLYHNLLKVSFKPELVYFFC